MKNIKRYVLRSRRSCEWFLANSKKPKVEREIVQKDDEQ